MIKSTGGFRVYMTIFRVYSVLGLGFIVWFLWCVVTVVANTFVKAEVQATCDLSLSTLNQIWMASHLPKPNPAHLCFTQSPVAESCHKVLVMDLSNSQSINQYVVNVLGRQLGPNRQEVQFSEFIQTRFASYMQSIP